MRRIAILSASIPLCLSLTLFIIRPAPADDAAAPAAARAEGRPGSPGASADLVHVQGTWEREVLGESEGPVRRVRKQIEGNKEMVTYFDKDGKVVRQHKVDFRLEQAGPVKLFTYFNHEVTEGPDKGQKYPGETSYVYQVNDREFKEVWGFLPGQEERPALLLVWKKARQERK